MRRLLVGLAIASIAVLSPCWVHADDQQIAQQIVQQLRQEKAQGTLAGFGIDLEVDSGIVWLKGHVASKQQQKKVLEIARHIPGVQQVVNDLHVQQTAAKPVAQRKATPQNTHKTVQRSRSLLGSSANSGFLSRSKQLFTGWNRSAHNLFARKSTQPAQRTTKQRTQPTRATAVHPVSVANSATRSDTEIAQEIIDKLRTRKNRGELRNFDVDVQVNNAVVWISGRTASAAQQNLVLDVARRVAGVKQVVNDLHIATTAPVQVASTPTPAPTQTPTPAPAPIRSQAPATLQPVPTTAAAPMPLAFAPARSVAYGAQAVAQPIPAVAAPTGVARARFDHPQMPGYAWPSYAAYPNYAAVTYPRQYSPTAWPYIGPFYPYPQVPLGWRKVTLEWDDGWWMLDFKSK